MKMLVDNDWLRRAIPADPDIECEAGCASSPSLDAAMSEITETPTGLQKGALSMATQMQARAPATNAAGLLASKPSIGVTEKEWTRVSLGATECEVAILYVTPAMARGFLEGARKNRHFKGKNVEYLSRQLNRDLWAFTGQPLIFNRAGQLMDGQHRCHAAARGGKAFLTLAVRGISDDAFDRLDSGSRRTNSDNLGIEGVKYATTVAALMPYLLNARTGSWWNTDKHASAHEVHTELANFPGVEQAAAVGRELAKKLGHQPSLWAASVYMTGKIDAAQSKEFFGRLISGLGLNAGDPEAHLRARMLEFQRKGVRPTHRQFAGLVARAWNARRANRSLQFLRMLDDGQDVPPIA